MKKQVLQKTNCTLVLIASLFILNAFTLIFGWQLYEKSVTSFSEISINKLHNEINVSELLVWYDGKIREAKWQIVESVSSENLRNTVSYLSQTIGIRITGRNNEKQAAAWMVQELQEYGYLVEEQPFLLSNGLKSQNVFAYKDFAFVEAESTIIIGAHYDSVATSPGAMDNASGVSAVLEIARVAYESKINCNLVFVLFGGEECINSACSNFHQGSKYYVAKLTNIEKLNVLGMINLDMVAEDGEVQIRREAGLSEEFSNEISQALTEVDLAPNIVQSLNWSDHESFEAVRIPAVFIFTPSWDFIHTGGDTIDKVHFEKEVEIVKGVVWYLLNEECRI